MELPDGRTSLAAALGNGIGVYEWYSHGELRWDATAAQIFGAAPGDAPADVARRRIHPDDQQRVTDAFAGNDLAEDLYRVVLDDGSIRWVLSRVTRTLTDERGEVIGIAGVMVDVTSVHEAAGRIGSILESISDGFFSLDRQWRFTYLNAAAERLLGRRRAELLGSDVWEAFPDAVGTEFEAVYRHVMDQQDTRSFEAYYPEPLDAWFEVTAEPLDDGIAVYFQDVTDRRSRDAERETLLRAEQEARRALAHRAAHDPLTGLLSREEVLRQGGQLLQRGVPVTLLLADLDRFKLVNDSLGHAAGDQLLVEIANRLTHALRPQDRCARLGGDEFVVLLADVDDRAAEAIAGRILHDLRTPVVVSGRELRASMSIGLVVGGSDATVDTLLRDADVALYRAKATGRDRFAWYDSNVHGELLERVALEADLRRALQDDGLDVHHQPVFDLATGAVVGVEALARWQHADRGPIAPSTFIPLAEEAGLISELADVVLRRAARDSAAWATPEPFRTWVNVSPHQFQVPGMAAGLLEAIAAAGLDPARFGIEVTESALADELAAQRELVDLADAGIAIAIDDFGTGYSSLSRLQDLPIDTLKVDRSFVESSGTEGGRAAVTAIVQLAHALGMTAVAEGIDAPEHLAVLRELRCDYGAGYLLARPAPAAAIGEVIAAAAVPGAGLEPATYGSKGRRSAS
jgi:diguanylate cyclase (GGDEF)-like protein/PAS domain S-box-containing protein